MASSIQRAMLKFLLLISLAALWTSAVFPGPHNESRPLSPTLEEECPHKDLTRRNVKKKDCPMCLLNYETNQSCGAGPRRNSNSSSSSSSSSEDIPYPDDLLDFHMEMDGDFPPVVSTSSTWQRFVYTTTPVIRGVVTTATATATTTDAPDHLPASSTWWRPSATVETTATDAPVVPTGDPTATDAAHPTPTFCYGSASAL